MLESVIIIIILFIILEVITAFIVYPLKTGKIYYKLISAEDLIFRFDKITGYSLRPNIIYQKPTMPLLNAPRKIMWVDIRTDKNAFLFTEDISLLKEKLIFCIGGSTTMGAESHYNKTYPAILDSLVKKYGYRCINVGVGGYRSIHELLLLKHKLLSFKPSAIIIFSGYNDFEDFAYNFYKPYNQFRHCLSHSLSKNKLFYYSAFLHMSKRLIYQFSGNMRLETISMNAKEKLEKSLKIDTWLNEWKDNIGKIINLCKENKVKCYLLSNVSATYENAPQEVKDFANKDLNMCDRFDIYVQYTKLINKTAKELCSDKGATFLDITSDFNFLDYKKRFSLFVDRMHFTEEGNLLVAESIYKKIKEDL